MEDDELELSRRRPPEVHLASDLFAEETSSLEMSLELTWRHLAGAMRKYSKST